MLLQATGGVPRSAHVIVLGNEKGGSGKSTTAMHIAVSLLKAGQRVATIDLDSRQKTFTHYVENRRDCAKRTGIALEVPDALLHRARRRRAGRRERGGRVRQLRGRDQRSRAHLRFRGDRYARQRHLPDAARAFDGRHAGDPAQRQFPRFRRARHGRSATTLRGHGRQPLCPRWCATRAASAASSMAG